MDFVTQGLCLLGVKNDENLLVNLEDFIEKFKSCFVKKKTKNKS